MVASQVRGLAGSAALGAAFLMYFGYFNGLLRPTGTDLFSQANLFYYYALRAGGVAMLIIVFWSLTGHVLALVAFGVVALLFGSTILVSGLLMWYDGWDDLNGILSVVFGIMGVRSSVSCWRDYRYLSNLIPSNEELPPEYQPRGSHGEVEFVGESLASKLRQQRAEGEAAPEPSESQESDFSPQEQLDVTSEAPFQVSDPPLAPSVGGLPSVASFDEEIGSSDDDPYSDPDVESPDSDPREDEDPPDGFLAGFS